METSIVFEWSLEEYSSKETKKIKCVVKRVNFLFKRITESDRDLTFDKEELASLIWMLNEIGVRLKDGG